MIDKKSFIAWLESDGSLPFDMYAQDINDWVWLQEFIPTIIVISAGGLAPFQASGTLQGLPFYYRDRHGVAELRVGSDEDSIDGNWISAPCYSSSTDTDEFRGGENFIRNMITLVPLLEKSPFPYRFNVDNDSIGWVTGWGHSPGEGYLTAVERFSDLVEGVISDTPLNSDERVFRVDPPVFTVSV